MSGEDKELLVGHGGAGDDCLGKVVKYGGNSGVVGVLSFENNIISLLITPFCFVWS